MGKDSMLTSVKEKGRVAILKSINMDFGAKNISREKENHFIMADGSIYQEYISILNVYEIDMKASKPMKQKLIEL